MDTNFCVICGEIIPEGLMACPLCEGRILEQSAVYNTNLLKDAIKQEVKNANKNISKDRLSERSK